MRPRTLRLDARTRAFTMVVLGAIVVAIALAGRVGGEEKSAVLLEAEVPRLIAACNRAVEGGIGKRRAMRASETLAKANRLGLVEPVASTAYQRYQTDLERWQTCQRSQMPVPAEARWYCPR